MRANTINALGSVAYKEFLHILRDWRILLLLVTFPPVLTLMLGHAFELTELKGVPMVLRDADKSEKSRDFVEFIKDKPTFAWQIEDPIPQENRPMLLEKGVAGVLTIPPGWGAGLANKEPKPVIATLDGTDTTTAPQLEGALYKIMGEYQLKEQQEMVDNAPDEVIEMGKKLPAEFQSRIVSVMEPWKVESETVYNPKRRFVDFVAPGLIGLILQLLTVPLMAVTLTRERETGTLSQLLLTSLRHWQIVVGKVIPYLVLSVIMVGIVMALTRWHFEVTFPHLPLLCGLAFLLLLSSLGLGLVISALCNTQAQAIQIAVFFLVPLIPLSGAFAPLEQLPAAIRYVAECFPLTHFCRAFRRVHLANADFSFYAGDVAFLALGALVTFAAAALLLRRAEN